MKKLIYIFCIVTLTLMVTISCEDFLKEDLYSDLGEGSFPADMAHAETMISEGYARGLYAFVTHHRLIRGVEHPTPSSQFWHREAIFVQNLGLWSWATTYSDPSYYDLLDRSWAVVRSCNDIIDLLPSVELEDKVRKDEIIGEAQFLRALCYFNMARLWGGMPIIDKGQTLSDDLYPARATLADTYTFIINDLNEAATKLRTRSDQTSAGVPLGHPTKNSALGLLGKVYVTMAGAPLNDASHLGDAKTVLGQVISSGEYDLMPDFPSVFDWKNNNNRELLFSWQQEGNDQSSYALFYFMPKDHDGTLWMPLGLNGIEYHLVPPEWVEWHEARDNGPRFQYTIIKEYTTNTGEVRVYNGGPKEAGHIGKYRAADYPMNSASSMPTDFPVLRYADILLLYAETINELEGPGAAYQYINQVRERAELPPLSGLSKDQLRDAIFEERFMELTYECDMLFDMRRRGWEFTKNLMEGFYKADQNGYPNGDAFANLTVEEHEMLFPYPPNDLLANPNLVGNPGYNQ